MAEGLPSKIAKQSKPVLLCNIIGCPNNIPGMVKSTVFYFVPKDLSKANKWASILQNRIGGTALSEALICANHFKSDAIVPNSKKLTDTAVPTLFPHVVDNQNKEPPRKKIKTSNVTSVSQEGTNLFILQPDVRRLFQSQNKSNPGAPRESIFILEASDIKSEKDNFSIKNVDNPATPSNMVESIKESKSHHHKLLENANSAVKDIVDKAFEKEVERLRKTKQFLISKHNSLLKEEATLAQELASINETLKHKRKELIVFPEKHLDVLKKCLSPCQIRHLMGKSRTRWSVDDLAMSYTISCLGSHDFYKYLHNEIKFPLPSASNTRRYYRVKVNRKNLEDNNSNDNETGSNKDFENDD